jgi:hypothetical protein
MGFKGIPNLDEHYSCGELCCVCSGNTKENTSNGLYANVQLFS